MSSRLVYGLRLRQLTHPAFSSRSRHLPPSSRSIIAPSLSFDASTNNAASSSSSHSPADSLVAAKTRDLLSSLERADTNFSRPWGHYVDLLNYMGLEKLPLEVHQLVLRKCVPPAKVLRSASKREDRALKYPHTPHAYENRLQAVMKNIRSAGWQAELDDYHFVLEQFAAVGHYIGSRGVLKEMAFVGVQPSAKTYRLCLQALAFRLTLPCSEEQHPTLLEETTKMAREVIRDMRARDMPFESVDTDLAIRIFGATVDEKSFDELIKFSYGIDLAYPDRLPLEVVERLSVPKTETSEVQDHPVHQLQPLTTDGLNVIIDVLGRTGRISKMIQAFEVLTQPLPRSSQPPSSLFDEDEDDYSINPPSIPEPICPLPSARPNFTTFQLLIKHASRLDHAVIARHYLVYAWRTDRDEDWRIKHGLCTRPVDEIPPPLLAVNRNMLLPIFSLSNRGKRAELMDWTYRMIKRALRRKRKDLFWYTFRRATYGSNMARDDVSGVVSGSESVPRDIDAGPGIVDVSASTCPPSDDDELRGASDSTSSASSLLETPVVPPAGISMATPTISTSSPNSPPTPPAASSSAEPPHPETESSILDLDPDSYRSQSTSSPPGIFNIDLHISYLERDVPQLERLARDVEGVLNRTLHRVKERLGRRVWTGKDVWLADEKDRVPVTKKVWKEAVNFVHPEEAKLLRLSPKQAEELRREQSQRKKRRRP